MTTNNPTLTDLIALLQQENIPEEDDFVSMLNKLKSNPGKAPEVNLPTAPKYAPTNTQTQDDPRAVHLNAADRLYQSFAHAETGSFDNPWIRTAHEPKGDISTAYGPVQITATLAKDYLERKAALFNEKETAFMKRFLAQGEKFKKYRDHKTYGYGGTGSLIKSNSDKRLYESVAKKMLLETYLRNGEDLDKTIKTWRGVDDRPYANKIKKYWGS